MTNQTGPANPDPAQASAAWSTKKLGMLREEKAVLRDIWSYAGGLFLLTGAIGLAFTGFAIGILAPIAVICVAGALILHLSALERFNWARRHGAQPDTARLFKRPAPVPIARNDEAQSLAKRSNLSAREELATALISKAIALDNLHRNSEAVTAYDEVISRFNDETERSLREQLATAYVNRGSTLARLQRKNEALASFEEAIARFGDDAEPTLRERVATALLNQGLVLAELQRPEAALAAYGELIARFGNAPEGALRERVATALVNRGHLLAQLDRSEEALAVYDDAVSRLGRAAEPMPSRYVHPTSQK